MEILCREWDIVYVQRGKVSGIIFGLIRCMKFMDLAFGLRLLSLLDAAWVLTSHRLHRHANHNK